MQTIDKTKVDEIIDGLLGNDDLMASPEVWYGLHQIKNLQPVATDANVGDKISKFIDGLEEIFAHIRERHVDDSVCGLCEYDGAYIGQSGDWCNECPGFNRDDCFKLSDKTRRKWTEEIINALPTIQSQSTTGQLNDGARSTAQSTNLIDRQAAIDAVNNAFDRETLLTGFARSIAVRVIRDMPSAQPEPQEGHWIEGKIYRDVIECNCSECGQLMTTAASVRMNYCPNCGARMKGAKHETD